MNCFYQSREKNQQKSSPPASVPYSTAASSSTDSDTRKFGSDQSSQNASDISTGSLKTNSSAVLSQRRSNLKEFTFSELKDATKNFSRSLMVGEGGFGNVYKAVIRSPEDANKKIDVAVKQLCKRGLQGHKEWVTEVNVLGVVEHPNLVKLVGYCAEDDERGTQRLLIYEYMPNGSVLDHLSSRINAPLSWETRLKIARDAARGLAHLHEQMDFQIIFRDFKSSNILLDEQWNAKLSDFGLARLGPSEGLTHVSTAVVGTIGYAAPEYIRTGRLTYHSDIWSYGVFLYELITGRRPFDRNRPRNDQNMLEWVKRHISDAKKFPLIIDPRLEGKYTLESVRELASTANRCLVGRPKLRPKMSEVLSMVDKIVQATESESPQLSLVSSAQKNAITKSRSMRLIGRIIGSISGRSGSRSDPEIARANS